MEPSDTRPDRVKTLQVVSIEKESGKPSKYVLNYEALKKLLNPIKDIPVAIIPIVGPLRQGKSFILNYMIRFLSDPKNIDWIGASDEPLTGFGWKSDVDPQTLGLWLSQPFVLKQSNGQEMAVLLMDTQGVFDEYSNQRDWSTIVGISLLMSSCLVFNLFTNLQEDILTTLESFLEYGLMAAKSNSQSNGRPFQSLLFLIRDWNSSNQYKYGLNGGTDFLKRKLELKDHQSESARVVRQRLDKCFDEVSCFLMPKIGDKSEEEDFNGCVDGLKELFVDKMKEFIFNLLNPNQLKPKTIDNNVITGEEVLHYFQTYVRVFNSDKLPKPTDLVEATAKTKDLINLIKLKELNLNDLRLFIQSKPFVARKALKDQFMNLKNKTIERFEGLKKSNNYEIIKELFISMESHLKSNYDQIWAENESRRVKYITKMADNCWTSFANLVNQVVDSTFLDSDILDDYLRNNKLKVMKEFKQHFSDEYEELFATILNKLNKEIDNLETRFKADNRRRIADAIRLNNETVEEVIQIFKKDMKALLKDGVYRTKEQIKQLEKVYEMKANKYFANNCSAGDSQFKKRFVLEFEKKLMAAKQEFKELNAMKSESVVSNTEKLFNTLIEKYNQRMNDMFDTFASIEELSECHQHIKQRSSDQLASNISSEDRPFLDQLNKLINQSFDELKTKFNGRQESLRNSLTAKVIEAKEFYKKEMDCHLMGNVLTDQKLEELHEKWRREAIRLFKSHSIAVNNNFDVDKYSSDLKQSIAEEFAKSFHKNQNNRHLRQRYLKDIINDLLNSYEKQMKDQMDRVNNELQYIERHEDIKRQLIFDLKKKCLTTDLSQLEFYSTKLEERIDNSFKHSLDLLKLRLRYKETVTKNLITDVRKFYTEEMERHQKTSFLTKDKQTKNNESVLKRMVAKFESDRGVMSSEEYKKLIEDSVKDISEKMLSFSHIYLSCGHQCGGVNSEWKRLTCLQGCDGVQLMQDGEDMCMICFTDTLSCEPSIQLKCGHAFHHDCTKAVLMKQWFGPRITFTFSLCPICKSPIEHPFLEDILLPIRTLYEDVRRKALIRLEYEGLHQNRTDATNYAMERLAYYVCFKCKKAYYGGEARCDAEAGAPDDFDPSELVCGGCSDGPRAQVCPQHGTEFLQYKCRYCCSVAVFFCSGTTHYCNGCHGNSRWATGLGVLPECPVGPGGIKLPGECPLHVKHPPIGQEFALGCGVCQNAQTF